MYKFNDSRIQKISELDSIGIKSYPANVNININEQFTHTLLNLEYEYDAEKLSKFAITGAGRLRFKNEIGNLGFGRLYYENHKFQIMISKKEVSQEEFKLWKKLDLGDFVRFTGVCMRTSAGELTVRLTSLQLVSKCVNFMPDKVNGVTDVETLQRQRYIDLMTNNESYDRFKMRSSIIKFIRNFLSEEYDFMEVETPTLQSIPGGANARPFSTHHNALNSDLFMRIAPELYLKRLIVGGFPKVFEIGKNFRNEGISKTHNPEFTMVEFYSAFWSYKELMSLTTSLFKGLFDHLGLDIESEVVYGDKKIDFSNWNTISYFALIKNAIGVDNPYSVSEMRNAMLEKLPHIDTDGMSITKLWDVVFGELIEPNLINPTFVIDYPKEISPLAKLKDGSDNLTARFELFIAGFEIANGFDELNDPVEQSARFMDQVKAKSSGDDEAMYYDEDYINALSYGMPPTAGEGIGIDRLVMLLTNSQSIRDVILFPAKK